MTSQKQLTLAYGLALHLLILGIVCYVTFSAKVSDEPIRIMYKTNAGKVLFDHNLHCSPSGYGSSCQDCHHHGEEDTSSCSNCHQKKTEDLVYFESCLNCHEFEDIKDTNMITKTEALHSKCIQCHKDIESGAQECSQCHIL